MSFIANVNARFGAVPDDIIQLADQVRMGLILQLIQDISRVLKESLRHFNDTIISTFFVLL